MQLPQILCGRPGSFIQIFLHTTSHLLHAKSFIVSAGIMALMGTYWLYKRHKFDDKEFNDPFKLNRDR